LTLSETLSRDSLKNLRKRGAALRALLTSACTDTLAAHGYPNRGGSEPALTFVEEANVPHVLWELMYDGGTADTLDWESFWGFRVPMSHWIFATRPSELKLQRGVFGGIHEELPFAAQEIREVAQYVQPTGVCSTAADHFKQFVVDELVKAGRSPSDAAGWIGAREQTWLMEFLADESMQPDDVDQWKLTRIIQMLSSTKPLHLLHFACHSQSKSFTATSCEITMKVGGEKLTFDVGDLQSNAARPVKVQTGPGPLVFLNACRSVKGQREFHPPPFATAWLQYCGAQAVIGAVCPVPDVFAHAFAIKYYDFLFGRTAATFDGRPVKGSLAGALLATRRYFMTQHRNPLGLAYILYATEHTRLLGSPAE
jgi:hypothetical protein